MPTQPGQMLSHYRLIEKIGEGGMGVVYRAVDTRLDREVALKVIRQRGGDTPIIGQRLVREARLAARIEHPNIATVYELDEVDGQPFVAMELIRGQTLRDRLAEGPLQTGQVVSIMLDVCRGLEAAHERGVVHRDLKPENVAVTQDGTVKILDFGVSRLVERLDRPDTADDATRTMPLTQEGHVAGTIAYMSPEQLAGAQVDPRGDIFAVGVVIFELLNGKRPFEGGSREALASAILHHPPAPSRAGRTASDRNLNRILRRCLAKRPEARFQSVAELRAALEEVQRAGRPRGLGYLVAAATVVAAGLGLLLLRPDRPVAPDAVDERLLKVAVAPFAPVGAGTRDQGLVVREYVERELRKMQRSGGPIRLLEGAIKEPVTTEDDARRVGQDVGADVVCWGKVLRAGTDAEIDARLTLLRPMDQLAPMPAEAAYLPDPTDFLEIARRIPFDSPGQLEVLQTSARDVADLVATLSGLALIRAGDYDAAARTLASVEQPSPQQRFYLGLALLRQGSRREAEAVFQEVLDGDPDHIGARLGLISSRGHLSFEGVFPEDFEELTAALAIAPFDARTNGLLFAHAFTASVSGTVVDPAIASSMQAHFETLCSDDQSRALPSELKREIILTVVLQLFEERPSLFSQDTLSGCEPILDVLDDDPWLRVLACQFADNPPGPKCDDWAPDPGEVHPFVYVLQTVGYDELDESDEPATFEMLVQAAESDPDLAHRAPDWALSLAPHGDVAALNWLDRREIADEAQGNYHYIRGIILFELHRWEEAEAELRLAGEQPEPPGPLRHFLASTLVSQERFEDALDYIGEEPTWAKTLALAAQGRLCEAYAVSFIVDPILANNPELQELLGELCRTIEQHATIRDAYTQSLRGELRQACAGDNIEFNFGGHFRADETSTMGIRVEVEFSFGPSIDFKLPADSFALLRAIEALDSPSRAEVDSLLEELAGEVEAFARDHRPAA